MDNKCPKCGYPLVAEETFDLDLKTPIIISVCTNLECDADEIVEYPAGVPGQLPAGQLAFAQMEK